MCVSQVKQKSMYVGAYRKNWGTYWRFILLIKEQSASKAVLYVRKQQSRRRFAKQAATAAVKALDHCK